MAEYGVRGKARQDSPPERKRREMLLYLGISIAAVELFIFVGGLCYGFIASWGRGPAGLSFPWLLWASLAVIAPAVILLAVHQADVGLFRAREDESGEWQQRLPERMRRLYRILKGAPVVVVLTGLIVLGAALLTLDGALSAIASAASVLTPYIPHLVGGAAFVLGVAVAAAVWLNYRTRRLYEEYAFRREVLEKTGVIIVDKGSSPLLSGAPDAGGAAALEAGAAAPKALEQATLDVTPEEASPRPAPPAGAP
jgi:hypothetical protein